MISYVIPYLLYLLTRVLNTSRSATVDNGCQLVLLCLVTNDCSVQSTENISSFVLCEGASSSLGEVKVILQRQRKFRENPSQTEINRGKTVLLRA